MTDYQKRQFSRNIEILSLEVQVLKLKSEINRSDIKKDISSIEKVAKDLRELFAIEGKEKQNEFTNTLP